MFYSHPEHSWTTQSAERTCGILPTPVAHILDSRPKSAERLLANMSCYEPIILKPRRSAPAALHAPAGADRAERGTSTDPSLPPGPHRAGCSLRGSRRFRVCSPQRAPALSRRSQKHRPPAVVLGQVCGLVHPSLPLGLL